MPTGYTADIEKGISFKKFVLGCARDFRALVSMGDDSLDAKIPEKIEPGDYHLKALKDAEKALKKYTNMTLEEVETICEEEYEEEIKRAKKYNLKNNELKRKYEDMLTEVYLWVAPTSEHSGLKKFMIEQLKSSIEFECHYKADLPKKLSSEKWLLNAKKQAVHDIEYHTEQYAEEVKRCEERTEWIQQLLKSLK